MVGIGEDPLSVSLLTTACIVGLHEVANDAMLVTLSYEGLHEISRQLD